MTRFTKRDLTAALGFFSGEAQGRAMIACILRSQAPLDREFRDALADLFEGNTDLQIIKRPRHGNTSPLNGWRPAYLMQELKRQHPDWKQKQIVDKVCEMTGMKRTQVLAHSKKNRHLFGG
jgi:hypothetical protein